MKRVWIVSDCVVSPLGENTLENFGNLKKGKSGVERSSCQQTDSQEMCIARIRETEHSGGSDTSKLESISIRTIQTALRASGISANRALLIVSTTKGNIGFLEKGMPNHPRIHLHALAAFLSCQFGFKDHLVVSNACVSGVMALIVGKRLLEAGAYNDAVVLGVDVLSQFVISGFQSLQALSPEPCRPFDADRKGINLGEGAAAVVLSSEPEALPSPSMSKIRIMGSGLSNDANHISGPSRTGEELGFAIQAAMEECGMEAQNIDFISAHGTATLYNDEMESMAFNLMGLNNTPVNSLKGYFGHTLGAAGLLETAISCESLRQELLVPTLGFEKLGVSQKINVIRSIEARPLETCLKTASGFGGCNAAIILKKEY